MEKSEDVPWGFVRAEEQLIALVPRLEPARSTHVSDFLIVILEKSTIPALEFAGGPIGCVGTASGGRARPAWWRALSETHQQLGNLWRLVANDDGPRCTVSENQVSHGR